MNYYDLNLLYESSNKINTRNNVLAALTEPSVRDVKTNDDDKLKKIGDEIFFSDKLSCTNSLSSVVEIPNHYYLASLKISLLIYL